MKQRVPPRGTKDLTTMSGDKVISETVRRVHIWSKAEPCNSDEEVAERLNEFFEKCADNGEVPTVEKLGLALGVSRMTLCNWRKGTFCSELRQGLIERAYQEMHAIESELALSGKIDRVVYIFRAKNFFGMRDQAELTIENRSDFSKLPSAEDVRKQYIEASAVDILPDKTTKK